MEVPETPSFKLDEYKSKHQKPYKRYIAKCTWHDGCVKKRNLSKNISHGVLEPIAYLCAWNAMGGALTPEEHCARGLEVPPLDVARWACDLNDKAQPVLDLA